MDSQENEQQLSVQDYLRVLYRGRWIILASFLGVLIVTAYFTFTTKPVYQARAKILVESQGSMQRALFEANYLNPQSTTITNQVEILKSRTLAERVVLALEAASYRDSLAIFQPNEDGNYMIFRKQVDWIMSYLEVIPKTDTDIIEIVFSAQTPFEAAEICNTVASTYRLMNKEANLAEFKDLRQFLEFQLSKKSEELKRSEDLLRVFRENEKLVSLDDRTKELITQLAQAQASMEATQVEQEAAQEQKRNLEKQLDERRQLFSSDVTQISSPLLSELQQEYARMVSEKVKYESLIAQEQSIDPKVYQLELKSQSNRIRAVQQRLEEEAQRIATTSMVSDPLQIAQNHITTILQLETSIKGNTAKINALREVVSQYEQELEKLPGQGLELARLERQVSVDQNIYALLTEKLEETKISEAGQKETVRVVDNAIEPEEPISPKKRLNLLLGALIGLGLGIGLTFLLEFFDDSIKNPEILEKMGFPILGIIPEISSREVVSRRFSTNGGGERETVEDETVASRLITHLDPKSPVSEAYRTLRTNIQFQKLKNKESALMVTSSAPKEGKSTTIANLAITMAQMGSKTLLVDTDLRRPVIHSVFNLGKDRGITNFLLGKMSFSEIVKPTMVDNLSVVTSGPLPPNPSELLASEEMDEFIEQARSHFDVVLFDSPPVIAVTDAAILSTKVDGLILVVKAHQTQKTAIARAKNLLENVKAHVVGCLLNSVNVERAYGSYYHYYYYHYYSYYGHDLKRRKKSNIA
ncbi:MAG: polysaccharide biosynthesis tyrosine autokinase [Calditrichaceae bacterium]|nr:polysaccharide biosynthesis tyrosine autokinase [Calditrichia bacterium]NUQ43751.1 polysaccharide biosynthesis tyrosine autokinase [Calditrichaceae bacterium]